MYKYKFLCKQCLKELKPSMKNGTLLPMRTYIGIDRIQFTCPYCNKVKILDDNGFSDIKIMIEQEY